MWTCWLFTCITCQGLIKQDSLFACDLIIFRCGWWSCPDTGAGTVHHGPSTCNANRNRLTLSHITQSCFIKYSSIYFLLSYSWIIATEFFGTYYMDPVWRILEIFSYSDSGSGLAFRTDYMNIKTPRWYEPMQWIQPEANLPGSHSLHRYRAASAPNKLRRKRFSLL